MLRGAVLVCSVLFAGCASAPTLPEGTGRGIIAFDPAPPAGAKVWDRPTLRVGDRFVLLRGGTAKKRFEITEAGEQGYTLLDENEVRLKRDRDLGNLGEWPKEGDAALHLLSPVDARYHWPLWVGKRWRCEFCDRTRGGSALVIEASYEVEAVDTIRVPAGTFEALRILRTARLKSEGATFIDRTIAIWYAPEIGLEVRQLLAESSVELVEWTRGQVTSRS